MDAANASRARTAIATVLGFVQLDVFAAEAAKRRDEFKKLTVIRSDIACEGLWIGDARLRDLKPELEQFAVDTWRAPKRIFDAHPPDQYPQLCLNLRSPSRRARLPTPVAAKAGPSANTRASRVG
jgi:hypothetical protein